MITVSLALAITTYCHRAQAVHNRRPVHIPVHTRYVALRLHIFEETGKGELKTLVRSSLLGITIMALAFTCDNMARIRDFFTRSKMKVFFDSKAKSTGVDATALNKISFGVSMEDLYFLDDPCHFAQRDFFKHATGIHDNVALKEHIFDIARTAFQVFPYPCIWGE